MQFKDLKKRLIINSYGATIRLHWSLITWEVFLSCHHDVMSVGVKGCVRRRPPPHPPSAAMREKKKNGFIITLTNGNSFSPWRRRLYWGGKKKLQVHLTSRIPSGVVFGGLRDWMECYSPLSVMTQWLRRSSQVLTWNDKGHKLPVLKINRTPTRWNSGFKQRGQ